MYQVDLKYFRVFKAQDLSGILDLEACGAQDVKLSRVSFMGF